MNGKLAKVFEEKAAPPPVLDVESYRLILEKLLAHGKGYGKTQPVAAYLLRDMHIVTENGGDDKKQTVKVQPLYVVMDIDQWPNEYARSLVMQDIAVSYAKRMVGEGEMNTPDFKGPGLWTTKKESFEFDYIRCKEKTASGTPIHIYDPNPEAYRICLRVSTAVTIPTQWGTWTIEEGGTLAIRERDVKELEAALQSIRNGKATAEEALFEKDKKGKTVARFDVYGMMPGFLEDNYNPVPLKDSTRKASILFRMPCP